MKEYQFSLNFEVRDYECDMEGIVEAAVIGVQEEIFGQAIKAFVVLKEKSEVTEEMIMKYCAKNLEPFMVPKYVEFRNSLPKTPNGKIDKKKL